MVHNLGHTITFGAWKKISNILLTKCITVHCVCPNVRYTRPFPIGNKIFPICRTSGSGICHLPEDNPSSLGPKAQQALSPPNHIWRETPPWAAGISEQHWCLWAVPGPRHQSPVPWAGGEPLLHVTRAAPAGDGCEEGPGQRQRPCQEWGAQAGSGEDFSIPCGLWEGCGCCCGGCYGDVPQ